MIIKLNIKHYILDLDCVVNTIKSAEWLYYNNEATNDNHSLRDRFGWRCEYGHLELAKLLYSRNTNESLIFNMDSIFINTCSNGHLHVAQWPLTNFTDNIHIHSDNDSAFRLSCLNGHFKIAQSLNSLVTIYTRAKI